MSLWLRNPFRRIKETWSLTAVLFMGRGSPSVPSPKGVSEFPNSDSHCRKTSRREHPDKLSSSNVTTFLIVVVDPNTNEFEFVQVEHNIYSTTIINEVIQEIIPQSATDETLAGISYQGICDCHGNIFNRNTRLSDIVIERSRSISASSSFTSSPSSGSDRQPVILVAVPSSSTPLKATEFAKHILCHPQIADMLKRNGIDTSTFSTDVIPTSRLQNESIFFVVPLSSLSSQFDRGNHSKTKNNLSLSLPILSSPTPYTESHNGNDDDNDYRASISEIDTLSLLSSSSTVVASNTSTADILSTYASPKSNNKRKIRRRIFS